MDFLDPKKQKAHARRLALGYALIGLVILLGTIILLYLAYGFGLDKNGRVIQNGLVFLSSRPSGANITINGEQKGETNTRLVLPAGSYTAEINRDGYHTWKRAITVEGGSLERFDYPFLFPSTLTTAATKQYAAAPLMTTQSLDRKWLLVQGATPDVLDMYDLNAEKPAAKTLTIPSDVYSAATTTTRWEPVEWSKDNRHLVLKRNFDKAGQPGVEYILLDRSDPALSQNLSALWGLTPTTMQLREKKYDQYYLYDQNASQILTATLKKPTPIPLVRNVLAFKAEEDLLLYVTDDDASAGRVSVKLRQDDSTFTLRQTTKDATYLLDLANYNDDWVVAAGSSVENKVYVYRNPLDTLRDKSNPPLVPVQILKLTAPNYISFSANARFVMAENGDQFAVYDAENEKGYAYQLKTPLDAGVGHANWMDGFRLDVVSGGKLVVFDFDGANQRPLMAMNPAYKPFFDRNYRLVYAFNAQNALTNTWLLAPQDR
jgi:hypothetical protein